ncbi:hypothetical protein EV359DRAFT_60741 [Lentinula novae-zelandiae]|nr:hypothetical protein EV359DRAFT_60741 [Lentinula novae-zelandiae]
MKDLNPEGMFHPDPSKFTKKTIRGHKSEMRRNAHSPPDQVLKITAPATEPAPLATSYGFLQAPAIPANSNRQDQGKIYRTSSKPSKKLKAAYKSIVPEAQLQILIRNSGIFSPKHSIIPTEIPGGASFMYSYKPALEDLKSSPPISDLPPCPDLIVVVLPGCPPDPRTPKEILPTNVWLSVTVDNGSYLRQDAANTYKLQLKDLDLIDPIEVQPNPHGRGEMRKYNERDVAALARRLHYAKASNTTTIAVSSTDGGLTVLTPAKILALPSGPQILRTHALKDFDAIEPNPHGAHLQPMRYYNRCDVEYRFAIVSDPIVNGLEAVLDLSRKERASNPVSSMLSYMSCSYLTKLKRLSCRVKELTKNVEYNFSSHPYLDLNRRSFPNFLNLVTVPGSNKTVLRHTRVVATQAICGFSGVSLASVEEEAVAAA